MVPLPRPDPSDTPNRQLIPTQQCIIIGQDAKDVAAYTAGNDISARRLQLDRELAGPMPQADFSKGFDTFAPLGPALVSASVVTDPATLRLRTTVDGHVRQEGETGDLVFGVGELVAYLSAGTTLQRGSVIMTGTPGGELDWLAGWLTLWLGCPARMRLLN